MPKSTKSDWDDLSLKPWVQEYVVFFFSRSLTRGQVSQENDEDCLIEEKKVETFLICERMLYELRCVF